MNIKQLIHGTDEELFPIKQLIHGRDEEAFLKIRHKGRTRRRSTASTAAPPAVSRGQLGAKLAVSIVDKPCVIMNYMLYNKAQLVNCTYRKLYMSIHIYTYTYRQMINREWIYTYRM